MSIPALSGPATAEPLKSPATNKPVNLFILLVTNHLRLAKRNWFIKFTTSIYPGSQTISSQVWPSEEVRWHSPFAYNWVTPVYRE